MDGTAEGFAWRTALMLAFVTATQVLAASLLVRTAGFRDPLWTAACLLSYLVSFWVVARMVNEGMALSVIVPLLAAAVPLATVLVAVTLLGEKASWSRLGLLTVACAMVGVASRV